MTSSATVAGELELVGWRREMAELYAVVRRAPTPHDGHALWRAGRDDLFRKHPQSPLPADDPLRAGLRYAPYDPRLRYELALEVDSGDEQLTRATAADETTHLRRLGHVNLPSPIDATVSVWWLEQYGGGLFLPIRDRTAGTTSYGGGRYLLDTAKGADLGGDHTRLTIDLNFLYHPSCRYDQRWLCPLAPPANVTDAAINAGELL